jgi:signal peptidase I
MTEKTLKTYNWFLQVALALIIFFGCLRPYIIEAFRIPTPSMERTLLVGDHLLVLKVTKGQFIPWTDRARPLLHNFRGGEHGLVMPGTGDVAIGEVIVFRYPASPGTDFVKRVVALAGDTVQVRGDTLFVNGSPSPWATMFQDPFRASIIDENWPGTIPGLRGRVPDLALETLVENVVFNRNREPVYVVPDGHVFMMGDNRDHSSDSRIWGPLDENLIKGKALVIYWSWLPGRGFPNLSRITMLVR